MSSVKLLAGTTVVEIGHSVAAPFAGLILAELGAEVIKVENPQGGDYARGWGPPFWNGTASAFHSLNRGKSGVTVDFGDPVQSARLKQLILDRADVVIQNLRGGVMDRYGLGAAELTAAKPGLIYCDLGAFGASGPLASKPGYDPLMQAFAGLMSVTGEGGGRPPIRVGVSIIDIGSGMWAAIGILAALVERGRTGGGGAVATSLYETALAWMTVPLAGYQANGEVRTPHGSGTAEIVPYQCFLTRNGWLMIAAGNDSLFRKLCAALDRPDLGEDPRFRTNGDRVVNRAVLVPAIEATVSDWNIDELMAALDAAGVPNAPLQDVEQVSAHPQTEAVGILQKGPGGALPTVGLPLTFDGRRGAYERAAPELGQHNDAVFGPASAGKWGRGMREQYETVALERPETDVLQITLNRPSVANAMNTQMGVDLLDIFTELFAKPDTCRAVVLTGAGERAFCAGGDLKERQGMSDEQWQSQHLIFERMIRAILECPMPVIAAVNGAAYAGGCEIALGCDFIYAARTARFALTEVTIGIMPGAGGTQTLPRAVGLRRAKEVLLTGKPFTAEEAFAWGMVNRLCEPAAVVQEALTTARTIAENAPISVRQAKRSMHHGVNMSLADGMLFEIEAYNRMVPTEDRREGINSFNEKRKPVFKGR